MSTPSNEIMIARDTRELAEYAGLVEREEALAAVLYDAFDPNNCPHLSQRDAKALQTQGNKKAHTIRDTSERIGRSWAPMMNAASEAADIDTILLPEFIATLTVNGWRTGMPSHTPSALDIAFDEFRSKKSEGLFHIDGWANEASPNIHVTASGSGVLHIARLNALGLARPLSAVFHGKEGRQAQYMADALQEIELHTGTVAVFSAFGSRATNRGPTLHKVTTTSEFRNSVSIDQVGVAKKSPDMSARRILKKHGRSVHYAD